MFESNNFDISIIKLSIRPLIMDSISLLDRDDEVTVEEHQVDLDRLMLPEGNTEADKSGKEAGCTPTRSQEKLFLDSSTIGLMTQKSLRPGG